MAVSTGPLPPPAEGVRLPWREVPGDVRAAVERSCGSPIVSAVTQRRGFSPGIAVRVTCASGARFFVKGGTSTVNAYSAALHRQEADVLTALDPHIAGRLPVARLRAAVEHDTWILLVLDDVRGRHATIPWRDSDLRLVLAMLDEFATALTPSPIPVPSVGQYHAATLSGWRTLAATNGHDCLDAWTRSHLEALASLEQDWTSHAAGDTLLHTDARADNILFTGDGCVLVDWPHACRGAAGLDTVFLAPSVTMQGGPEPEELLALSATASRMNPDRLRVLVCALAGYFTYNALRPPPPGLPSARPFQAAQGTVTRRWLRHLW